MRSYFMPLLAIFSQKLNFWDSQPFIFRSNGRTNLIFNSGKIWDCKFFKKWKLEKGEAKGVQPIMFEFTQWLDQKMQIWPQKQTPELRIMVQMVGTNILKWCPPFVFRPPEQKSWIFPIFEAGILCSWASRDFCPPFLPPFWYI